MPGLRANLDKVFAVKDLPKRNRMYLFSDFQKHDWYNVQEIRTVHEVELFTPVFFKTGSNVFITGAAFIPGINDTRAAIEIYNNSSHHIAPLCRAEINGKPAGECIVHCPPHSGRKAVMKIEQQELQAGQIIRFTAAASDSLLLDNVHYYTAPGGHGKRKIFMYGAFPEKFRDLLLAAGGSMFSGIYSVTAEPPAKIGKILRSEQLPVLVTDNPAILNTAELLQYGPALTVICRVDQPSPGLDDFFRSGLFPMLPEGKITSEPGKICFIENDGPASYLPHEFTGEFFLNGFCRVKLHSNARPQIFLNENICFYALTDYRGTVIHAFNTGRDLSFFRRNELLPMLRNILQETRIPVHASLLPGSVFTAEKAITSMEYEGTGEKPRGILSNSSFLPSAGVYYFTSGKTRQAVVCNPDTRESILDQIPGKQIREISESVLGVRINYKTAHDQETGWRELWRLLLFIAMGISVMELVLAQLIRRGIREKN
ncbi:MAG TPA: hypothetical protein DC049_00250 [Spirochaetia bacterium]|nr:hypothetical protein [Spirochaetia bacterium]